LLSKEALSLYQQLLLSGGGPVDDPEIDGLAELRAASMVWESVDLPTLVHAVSPSVALHRLLDEWHREATQRHQWLNEQYAWLARLRQLDKPRGDSAEPAGPAPGISLHHGRDEIIGLQRDLVLGARKMCLSLETHHFERTTIYAREPGVAYRSICPQALLEDDQNRKLVRAAVDSGEEYRVLPALPLRMVIADRAALVPLSPAGADVAMVVQAPVVVDALIDYFERLWQQAAPVGASSDRPAEQRLEVLRLAATGLKDEAIARTLGISTRSVRRHVESLERESGVSNRLGLGIEAVRRGWV
jgi:DNA-binding CsgD family transcriptional regulator